MTEDVDWNFLPINSTCFRCDMRFSRPEYLAVHMPCFLKSDNYVDRPTGNGKSYRCQFCQMDYASLQGLVSHILFHFDKQYACLHCGLRFYTRRTVMNHATQFHSHETVPMEDTGVAVSEDDSLIVEPNIDPPVIKQSACDECGLLFPIGDELNAHQAFCTLQPIPEPEQFPEAVAMNDGFPLADLIPDITFDIIEVVASTSHETSDQVRRPKRARSTGGLAVPRRSSTLSGTPNNPGIFTTPQTNGRSKNVRRKSTPGGKRQKVSKKKATKKIYFKVDKPISQSKRKSTINGWVEGRVHHREPGINNKMLHVRDKESDDDETEVRKLYCKNSLQKRRQQELEEEERRRKADPKLSMDCFVELDDMLLCHVLLKQKRHQGMMIFS